MDYIIHFEAMYNKIVPVEDCSYKSLHEIHNHFMYNLRVTDRPLSELLETILFLKVTALIGNDTFIFYLYKMDTLPNSYYV